MNGYNRSALAEAVFDMDNDMFNEGEKCVAYCAALVYLLFGLTPPLAIGYIIMAAILKHQALVVCSVIPAHIMVVGCPLASPI